MTPQLEMFGLSIHFLMGLLLVLGVGLLLTIAVYTGIRVVIWEERKKRAAREERRRRFRPDGQPYPPSGRGVCTACSRACDLVYHLPGGERLCPACYEQDVASTRGEESAAVGGGRRVGPS